MLEEEEKLRQFLDQVHRINIRIQVLYDRREQLKNSIKEIARNEIRTNSPA